MYGATSLCLLVVAFTVLTASPDGYSESEIGIALIYGLLVYLVAFPSGLVGLIASIVVLARERKQRSVHAWMALLFIILECIFCVWYISQFFAPIE
jgi:hypothetical protein